MRPDIKLGIVISMVVVFVAGSYFMYRNAAGKSIPLATNADEPATPKSKTVATPTGTKQSKASSKQASNPSAAGTKSRSPNAAQRTSALTQAKKTPASNTRRTTPSNARNGNRGTPRRPVGNKRVQPKIRQRSNKLANRDSGKAATPVLQPVRNASAGTERIADRAQNQGANRQGGASAPATHRKQPVTLSGKPANSRQSTLIRGNGTNATAVETHRVQAGDTFASLAQRYYGDPHLTRFLIDNNPHLGGTNQLRAGQIVKIPTPPAASSRTRSTGKTYKVKSGDSFYKIAANVLGDASRWNELFELNKALVKGDPKRLQIGTEIRLPNQ